MPTHEQEERTEMICLAGQVMGMVCRYSSDMWRLAADTEGLYPQYREHILQLALLREKLGEFNAIGHGKSGDGATAIRKENQDS